MTDPKSTLTKTAEPVSRRGTKTRERIVSSAIELFAKNGYHGTGIAEILDVGKISRGSFYHYFEGKEDLLLEISLAPVENMCTVSSRIAADGSPAENRLRLLAEALVVDIGEHQSAWTVFFRDFVFLGGERRDKVLAARDRFESYWEQVLEAGYLSGAFREPSTLQLKGILGMLNYSFLWMNPAGKQSPAEIGEKFIGIVLDGIRA